MPSWVDDLVPAALRSDPEMLRRARLTVLLSAVLMTVALAYSLFYGLVVGFPAGAIITGGGSGVAVVVLAALRARPRLRAGGHVLTLVTFGVLASLVYHTGGLPSLVTPWLIIPPMFAALLLGRRSAAAWTVVCVLTITAFFLAERGGMVFPPGFSPEWTTTINFASFAGLVTSTAILLWVFEDIRVEAQARAEAASAELARLAYHDALTGLVNRARFLECLEAALSRPRAADDSSRVAVLLLDLDGFKAVNDSLGHAAGDALLTAVAGRLLNATRGCDMVARLGGDEFAVMLAGVRDEASVAVVGERIVAALAVPFMLAGRQASVQASVGIAVADPAPVAAAERHDEAEEASERMAHVVAALLHDADVAMYRAKALGKGRWVRFEAGMHAEPAPPAARAAEARCGIVGALPSPAC